MKKIEIKTPAKINLTLKVFSLAESGFHPIESIMQAISLFDYLTIELTENIGAIELSGTSDNIPYDSRNIIYKAVELFRAETGMQDGMKVFIEKNIPVCAGLAGGSTNAAGTLYGLNKIYNNIVDEKSLHEMCAKLGSDLNFCLVGGKCMASGRGEILEPMEFEEFDVCLVKPRLLGISAKEAYARFDELRESSSLKNDLEFALLPYYEELRELNGLGYQMSGSGPTFFMLKKHADNLPHGDFEVFENLKSIPFGVFEK